MHSINLTAVESTVQPAAPLKSRRQEAAQMVADRFLPDLLDTWQEEAEMEMLRMTYAPRRPPKLFDERRY